MRLSFTIAVLVVLAAAPAAAQNPVDFSPDITAPLGSAPSLVVNDHNLAHDDAAGGVTGFLIPAGALPANVQIEGYHPLANGNTLLALETTTALPGLPAGSPAEPRDVVEYTPGTGLFSVFFDGSAAGIPSGPRIDALYVSPGLDVLFSLDTSATLPGLGPVDDEDVVSYAAGIFTMAYDGSAAGVASALDLDALQGITGPAGWLISFDTSGTVGGVGFDDEDVLRYDSGLATYAMYFDASVSDPADWPRADLNALPEPDLALALASGAALLAGLCRVRPAPGSPSRRSARSTASPPCAGSCRG
jgi:hypothetical protein